MTDPFVDVEPVEGTDSMSRATDPPPAPTPAAAPAPQSSRGSVSAERQANPHALREKLAGRHVCPFCGTATDAAANQPCPRCTMEDTPATRQATKARIGPWYVLQTRNPSAPGMKFSTLLALVNKGQVTARSIVRGPTTHQLWRFAAHVRGLSREFGICYSCGEPLSRQASICPHCDRPQEPPANPDTLLEVRESVVGPASANATGSSAPVNGAGAHSTRQVREYELPSQPAAYPPPPVRPARGEHAQRLRALNGGAGAEPAPAHPAVPGQPRHRSDLARHDSRTVSAMELASALSHDANDVEERPGAWRRFVSLVLLLALAAGGIVLFLRPEYRMVAIGWAKDQLERAQARLQSQKTGTGAPRPAPATADPAVPVGPQLADARDDVILPPTGSRIPFPLPTSAPAPTTQPTDLRASDPSTASVATSSPSAQPQQQAQKQPQQEQPPAVVKGAPKQQPRRDERQQDPDEPDKKRLNAARDGAPQSPGDRTSDDTASGARQASDTGGSQPVAGGAVEDPYERARKLYLQALDAESEHRWADAARLYEQIMKLPPVAWQGDVQVRLNNAKRMLK